ncbi:MAG: protein TolQ [Pseudomonadota bacterium]
MISEFIASGASADALLTMALAAQEAAPSGVVDTIELEEAGLWSLILEADLVVKAVMGILVLASVWSWGVMIDKGMFFSRINGQARRFENTFWSGKPLDDLHRKLGDKADHPMARVFAAAMGEWERVKDGSRASGALVAGAKERIDKVMNVQIARELDKAERGLGFLATVGSAAPFIGLFGTVWGIMNSFQAIAVSQDTNLAVVAPGIAEALFATALGLVAAIPAVIFYNRLTARLNSYAVRIQGFADEFSAILSRQLDERTG